MQKILAGNWKMHKTRNEARLFVQELLSTHTTFNPKTRCVLIPSPTLLETLQKSVEGSQLEVFSQNCAYELEGALTGEISPLQLRDLGVTGTLIGHSERRSFFAESDETCERRAALALEKDLDVIYCIGESLEQREAGQTQSVILKQLSYFSRAVQKARALGSKATAIVAYEPIWAIGTAKVANPEQIREAHQWIHEALEKAQTPAAILYGGSVKPSNFREIASIPHVSGALVGGASLKVHDYRALLDILEN
jgi:triosephosphate isomerase